MPNIYINGLSGKMGQVISQLCKADNNKVLTSKNFDKIDVVIDFSRPESTIKLLKDFEGQNIPFVIGTTGFSNEQISLIKKASAKIPILLSFNMSKGIFTLKNSIKNFLKDNDQELQCFIEETHHTSKIDSPSGTAIELKNFINNSDSNKKIKSLNIKSLRFGDVNGIHKVCFTFNSNKIEFKHEALSRNIFAEGALEIANKILKKDPGLYQLQNFFDDK